MYKFTTTELCSMNGYPITDYDKIGVEDKKQIQQIRNKEIYEINKNNPNVSNFVNKYSDSVEFFDFTHKIKEIHNDISEYKKKRNAEYNRKIKLETLVQELNSLNNEIKHGKVICANCGSDKIIYKSKDLYFEVSNLYVRRKILSSIKYQISQKEEIIREYSYQLQQLQDELKDKLRDTPIELREVLLYSETILSEINLDNKLIDLKQRLEEFKQNNIENDKNEKEAKNKCKEMKNNIVYYMNNLYKEVDPKGRIIFDDIFTKKDKTYSGSEEISSNKEDIMINMLIKLKLLIIVIMNQVNCCSQNMLIN